MHHLLSSELLQSQEFVSQLCDRPCPFCQREYGRPIDLQQHIAGHLESTALLSLPNPDNIEEKSDAGQVNSNSANRDYAESRAEDFDRMEPLVFPENDHPGDIPKMTETNKELFRRKLEVESVLFDSMHGFNTEARQAYSSGLTEEWLSSLSTEVYEEGELRSETRSEPLSQRDSSPRIRQLLSSLNQLCSKIHEMCEDRDFLDFYTELRSLEEGLHVMKECSSLQRLSQTQMSKIYAILRYCEDIFTDTDEIKFKYESPDMKSRRTRKRAAQKKTDTIRSRLLSISSELGLLNTSYVTHARTSYEGLTFCSFPSQVKEGAVGSGEGLESSGQSRMRSILAYLIALGPSVSDIEGERPADDKMTPTSIPMSVNVTGSTELSIHHGTSNRNHWLPKVFSQSSQISLTTLEEHSDRSSACFGNHVPDAIAKLDDEGYASLAEFGFQNDQFKVLLYDQPYGYKPRIRCCTNRPVRQWKDSLESLVALNISRRGSFLDLALEGRVEEPPELWACIKFSDYESTYFRGLYLGLSLGWQWPYHDSHHPRGLQKAQGVTDGGFQ